MAVQRLLRTLPSENRLARANVLLPAVHIARAAGESEAAARAAAELHAIAVAVGTDALLAMSAVAHSVLAEPAEACTLLHEAGWRYHRADLRHHEAGARLLPATLLLVEGDAAAAREQIAAATDVLTDLADTAGLAHARQLAKSLDGGSTALLTRRETEALRLISRGMSNDQIAAALTLSGHTVHRHVANILTKLDQPTRAAAVTHALTAGVI